MFSGVFFIIHQLFSILSLPVLDPVTAQLDSFSSLLTSHGNFFKHMDSYLKTLLQQPFFTFQSECKLICTAHPASHDLAHTYLSSFISCDSAIQDIPSTHTRHKHAMLLTSVPCCSHSPESCLSATFSTALIPAETSNIGPHTYCTHQICLFVSLSHQTLNNLRAEAIFHCFSLISNKVHST